MAAVDAQRLVEIAQELLVMRQGGVRRRRLGAIALDLLVTEAATERQVRHAGSEAARQRAERSLAFLKRLEGEVVHLYARAQARRRAARQMGVSVGLTPPPG